MGARSVSVAYKADNGCQSLADDACRGFKKTYDLWMFDLQKEDANGGPVCSGWSGGPSEFIRLFA